MEKQAQVRDEMFAMCEDEDFCNYFGYASRLQYLCTSPIPGCCRKKKKKK
jgi:hypothetical protein